MNPIDRTALITGGNSGLGLECARALLQQQPAWHVIIASRGRERSEAAVDALRASGGPGTVEARALDLGSLADVRRFADGLLADLRGAALPPLRALVCNAGLQFTHRAVSADGFEATFAVNHLGHYLLTQRLLGALVPPARIVFVSSGTHDPAERTGMPHPNYRGARGSPIRPPTAATPTPAASAAAPTRPRSCATSSAPTSWRDAWRRTACRSPRRRSPSTPSIPA